MLDSEEYARLGGLRCPSCSSKEVVASTSWDADNGYVSNPCYCESCGAAWSDVYKLEGYDFLELSEPAQ